MATREKERERERERERENISNGVMDSYQKSQSPSSLIVKVPNSNHNHPGKVILSIRYQQTRTHDRRRK
jgi:hypothetical protein